MAVLIPGVRGYARQASELAARYEAVAFEDKFAALLAELPRESGDVLDIGAGTGADAAWFARRGHRVWAVEPTAALRCFGQTRHRARSITWIDDGLPDLARIVGLGRRFDLVLLSAVWMHLDARERARALPRVARLLADGGVAWLTLRHGPVPAGRRMFAVSAEETATLAQACGLVCVRRACGASAQAANRARGVTWTQLALRAAPAAS